jgi:alpha-L-arabinofuranosidase
MKTKKTYRSKQSDLEVILLMTAANFPDQIVKRDGITYSSAEYLDLRMSEHEGNGYTWASKGCKELFDEWRRCRVANQPFDWDEHGIDVMTPQCKKLIEKNYNIQDSTEACMAAYILHRNEQIEKQL